MFAGLNFPPAVKNRTTTTGTKLETNRIICSLAERRTWCARVEIVLFFSRMRRKGEYIWTIPRRHGPPGRRVEPFFQISPSLRCSSFVTKKSSHSWCTFSRTRNGRILTYILGRIPSPLARQWISAINSGAREGKGGVAYSRENLPRVSATTSAVIRSRAIYVSILFWVSCDCKIRLANSKRTIYVRRTGSRVRRDRPHPVIFPAGFFIFVLVSVIQTRNSHFGRYFSRAVRFKGTSQLRQLGSVAMATVTLRARGLVATYVAERSRRVERNGECAVAVVASHAGTHL